MKRTYLLIVCCFLLFQGPAMAAGLLQGEIIASFSERIDLANGDKIVINLGKSQGVAKGDIAKIARRGAVDPLLNTQAQCAVIQTDEATAVCEIFKSKTEVHRGDTVFLQRLESTADAALFPLAQNTLQGVVQPYDASKRLTAYVYSFFNDKNEVTALSEKIKWEIVRVLRQKTRITIADSRVVPEPFYPDGDMDWTRAVKEFLRKVNVDAFITGTYKIQNDQLVVTIYKLDRVGDDRKIDVSVPLQKNYEELAGQVRVPYEKIERRDPIFCYFALKSVSYTPAKDEKPTLIKFEADGNPFVEYSMKRDDFNIISPVDFVVKVDNETINLSLAKPQQFVTLARGTHRVSMSFRRGYYFNDNLLYKSKTLINKEALLDLTKTNSILVDLSANPLADKQPITIQVYDRVGKERPFLRPLRRLEDDTTVETFKD